MRGGDWGGGWEWAAMIGRESGNGRWGLGGRVGMEGSDWERGLISLQQCGCGLLRVSHSALVCGNL